MTDDVMAKLANRKKAVTDEFDALIKTRAELQEQRTNLDRQLSEIQARQVQLQGAYQELEALINPPLEGEIVRDLPIEAPAVEKKSKK